MTLKVDNLSKSLIYNMMNNFNLKQISKELLSTFDKDEIEEKAKPIIEAIPILARTPEKEEQARKQDQKEMINKAASSFNGKLNDYIEKVRIENGQIIDSHNIDKVTKAEWDTTSVDKAKKIVKDFSEYLEANQDEIKTPTVFYKQPYNRRNITFKVIKEVFDKLSFIGRF